MAEKKNIAIPTEDEFVTIMLPRTRKDEEDEVVWVNERRFLIKRGIAVSVPKGVAEILANKDRMLEILYDFEDKVQK